MTEPKFACIQSKLIKEEDLPKELDTKPNIEVSEVKLDWKPITGDVNYNGIVPWRAGIRYEGVPLPDIKIHLNKPSIIYPDGYDDKDGISRIPFQDMKLLDNKFYHCKYEEYEEYELQPEGSRTGLEIPSRHQVEEVSASEASELSDDLESQDETPEHDTAQEETMDLEDLLFMD